MKRLTVLIALLTTSTCSRAASPNLVFILIDDMGWPGTSVEMVQGVEESASDFYLTPNIEELAKQGMRFSRAYSPGPMCTPSRAGILTGKTPAELHMTTPGGGGGGGETSPTRLAKSRAGTPGLGDHGRGAPAEAGL